MVVAVAEEEASGCVARSAAEAAANRGAGSLVSTGTVAHTLTHTYDGTLRRVGQGLDGAEIATEYDRDDLPKNVGGVLTIGRNAASGLVDTTALAQVNDPPPPLPDRCRRRLG